MDRVCSRLNDQLSKSERVINHADHAVVDVIGRIDTAFEKGGVTEESAQALFGLLLELQSAVFPAIRELHKLSDTQAYIGTKLLPENEQAKKKIGDLEYRLSVCASVNKEIRSQLLALEAKSSIHIESEEALRKEKEVAIQQTKGKDRHINALNQRIATLESQLETAQKIKEEPLSRPDSGYNERPVDTEWEAMSDSEFVFDGNVLTSTLQYPQSDSAMTPRIAAAQRKKNRRSSSFSPARIVSKLVRSARKSRKSVKLEVEDGESSAEFHNMDKRLVFL